MLKWKLHSGWMLMWGGIWQMVPQNDDTISLSVCKVCLITKPAPQPEDDSCFSPYAPSFWFLQCPSLPSAWQAPWPPLTYCLPVTLNCHQIAQAVLEGHRHKPTAHWQIKAHVMNRIPHQKKRKNFYFFYCINNGKLDSFFYTGYIFTDKFG